MKENFKRVACSVIVMCVFIVLINTGIFAANGEWVQEGENWKYKIGEEYIYGEQKLIDGKWYTFDDYGVMLTGFQIYDDKCYYLNDDGTAATGPIVYKGKSYSINNKGQVQGISEDDFIAYRDSISSSFILGGGYDEDISKLLNVQLDFGKKYFNELQLSKRVFELVQKHKGYNADSVNYVIKSVGINWKEQAKKCGAYYFSRYNLTREELKNLLLDEEFTEVEALYGTETVFNDNSIIKGDKVLNKNQAKEDYANDMSMSMIGEKVIVHIQQTVAQTVMETITQTTQVASNNKYSIVSKANKTYQVTFDDDDAKSGVLKIKLTISVPTIKGEKEAKINNAINTYLFGAIKKYLQNHYYDEVVSSKSYKASSVNIESESDNEIVLSFFGDYPVSVTINLNTFEITTK